MKTQNKKKKQKGKKNHWVALLNMIGMILLCFVLIFHERKILGLILMPFGLLLTMPSYYIWCREDDTFASWSQFIRAIIVLVGLFICFLILFIRGFE